jgi:hypothetical protein
MKKSTEVYKPTSLKVFSREFKIQYIDTIGGVDLNDEDHLYGCINFRDNTIRIYNNFVNSRDHYKTLLHELIHAIATDISIDFKTDSEERIIDNIALGLADILISNNIVK